MQWWREKWSLLPLRSYTHVDTVTLQSIPLSLSQIKPTHVISQTLNRQSKDSKPGSIFGEIIKQSTNQHSNGSKLTTGAAMLLGISIMVSPFKEGSPAKIILNTTDILLKERRRKHISFVSLAWWKLSYTWVLVHLWAVVVAVAAWWKVSQS